jgi:lambda family phage portal protein
MARKKTTKKTPINLGGSEPLKRQATGGPGIFSNFESAKFSNKRSWIWSSWPTDFKKTMTVFDRLETTRKMRWMELNSGIIRQVLSDMALYSVGDGIKATARTGSGMADKQYEEYFDDWARNPCDITGRFNFYEIQHIITRLVYRDGECFILKTRDGSGLPKLQIIEAHRVSSAQSGAPPPDEVDGIKFGKYGKPEWYNIMRSDGSSRRVPAGAVMHIYEPEVASGARAYSPLQHSINNIVDMLEIISLEKFAVKMNSDIVRTLTRETAQFDGAQSDFEAFGMRPQGFNDGVTDPNEASTFIGGKILALSPGEKLESFVSNRPNPTFNGFMEHLIRDSLAGILPYEFVHDPAKAGGASMRLIVAKAARKFGHFQSVLMNRLLTPVWGYVMGDAITHGAVPSCENWNKVLWTTPKSVTVDAGRDAAQNRADIEYGLKTIGDNCLEEGEHFSTMVRRRAVEAKMFKDMAKEYDVPLWMLIKPTNVALMDITAEEPKEEGEDIDEDMDEKSSAEVSNEGSKVEEDDAESDELEDPQGK